MLILYRNVTSGLVVYQSDYARFQPGSRASVRQPRRTAFSWRPWAAGDRQDLHERIRRHSQAAADVVKKEGVANDLMARLAADPAFAKVDLAATMVPSQFVGRAPQQVDEFLAEVVNPILDRYPNAAAGDGEVKV